MVQFNVPKNLGYAVVNVIRQFALTETDVIRVVGFSLGEQELLKSGDIDLVDVSSVLGNLDIEFDDLEGYPTVKNVRFNEVLTVGDLRSAGIKVKNAPDDRIILNGFKPGVISLILNKCKHYMSSSNNKALLESNNMFNISGFNIIHSKGANMDVQFRITQGLDSDLVELDVNSEDSTRILGDTLASISDVFQSIGAKIS